MGRKKLDQVEVESGALVKVGSDVALEVEGEELPCVAKVIGIFVDKKDNAKFSVCWYYFPDDVKKGRQSYHAMDEIFESDHIQSDPLVSSKTVIWTCAVLSLSKWIGFVASDAYPDGPKVIRGPVSSNDFDMEEDLAPCKTLGRGAKPGKEDAGANKSKNGSDEDEEDMDDDKNRVYMCRHAYMAQKHQWKDVEVPVFCICDLPYNPDNNMVQCCGCGEWYHPDCLELKKAQEEAINAGEQWTCPRCVSGNGVATTGH